MRDHVQQFCIREFVNKVRQYTVLVKKKKLSTGLMGSALMGSKFMASLKRFKTIVLWCTGASIGPPHDASLSDCCASLRFCFSSLALLYMVDLFFVQFMSNPKLTWRNRIGRKTLDENWAQGCTHYILAHPSNLPIYLPSVPCLEGTSMRAWYKRSHLAVYGSQLIAVSECAYMCSVHSE